MAQRVYGAPYSAVNGLAIPLEDRLTLATFGQPRIEEYVITSFRTACLMMFRAEFFFPVMPCLPTFCPSVLLIRTTRRNKVGVAMLTTLSIHIYRREQWSSGQAALHVSIVPLLESSVVGPPNW